MNLILDTIISSGFERDCWQHPDDIGLCVKTTRILKTDRNQNQQEYDYYQYLIKNNKLNKYIPRIHGWVETNKGKGLIIDRVINYDNSASIGLENSLKNNLINTETAERIIREFFVPFLKYGVVVSDECFSNFFVSFKKDGPILMVIDGLGHRRVGIKSWFRDKFVYLANRKTLETKNHLLDFVNSYKDSQD